ncbi:MAG: hypothetical protein SV375_19415, partial [Thermodesulfobacteriota bacterium]|nr:hypothetical protein [Thermodesulfobacteriota bacterium]
MTEILFREIYSTVKEIPQKRCVVVLTETSRQVNAINAAAQAGLIKPVYVCNKKIGAMRDFIRAKTL